MDIEKRKYKRLLILKNYLRLFIRRDDLIYERLYTSVNSFKRRDISEIKFIYKYLKREISLGSLINELPIDILSSYYRVGDNHVYIIKLDKTYRVVFDKDYRYIEI